MSDERERLDAAHQASVRFVERIIEEGPSIKPLVRETVEQHSDYVMALARNWMTNGDTRHGEMVATMMLAAQWWARDQANPERAAAFATLEAAHAEARANMRRAWDDCDDNDMAMHWSAVAGWLRHRIIKLEAGEEPDWPDAMTRFGPGGADPKETRE